MGITPNLRAALHFVSSKDVLDGLGLAGLGLAGEGLGLPCSLCVLLGSVFMPSYDLQKNLQTIDEHAYRCKVTVYTD